MLSVNAMIILKSKNRKRFEDYFFELLEVNFLFTLKAR